jgi:DNA transposition AAA+ family ATPase
MSYTPTIDQATASSAHSRINVPLNLTVWRDRPQDEQDLLTWFHQHCLDHKLTWEQACDALGYDRSNVFRILKGTYNPGGTWAKPMDAIVSYKRIAEARAGIQKNQFAENSISKLIWAGLDYAMANNSITMVIGESRMGKTLAAIEWAARNNHGRSVLITARPVGGTKGLARNLCQAIGANQNQSLPAMVDSIYRGFNKNRILIVDEAHRLMPGSTRTINPANLEFLRDIHDQTGCGLALLATARFQAALEKGEYQYEQLIGRIGMPIRLPKQIKRRDTMQIIQQFLPDPSSDTIAKSMEIANAPGRLGILVETLKVASRIASKAGEPLSDEHFTKAIAIRNQMMTGH